MPISMPDTPASATPSPTEIASTPRRRNADQLRGLAIVGDRAHRLADARAVQKQIKRSRDHRSQHGGENMGAGKGVAAEAEAGHATPRH